MLFAELEQLRTSLCQHKQAYIDRSIVKARENYEKDVETERYQNIFKELQ